MTRATLFVLLMLAACETGPPDVTPPTVRMVFPAGEDTLAPGVCTLKAVATDDREMQWVSFWSTRSQSPVALMLGIVKQSRADTFSIGWDCPDDTTACYDLAASARDRAGNTSSTQARVWVRR
jgi:hypothetical protein